MTRRRQNPRTMAIAFRIWANCQTHGWYRTIEEIAEAVGENWMTVRTIMVHRGWHRRTKSVSQRMIDTNHNVAESFDRALEAMS